MKVYNKSVYRRHGHSRILSVATNYACLCLVHLVSGSFVPNIKKQPFNIIIILQKIKREMNGAL